MDDATSWPSWVEEDYYPSWLRNGLIDGAFPWERASTTTLAHFLDAYTLHDSIWLGVWVQPDGGAVAVLRFETAWTNDRIPYEEEDESVPFWPILLMRLATLRRLTADEGSDQEGRGGEYIQDATSGPLENEGERNRHETIVHGSNGMQLRLVHDATVSLLLMNRAGTPVPIPGS